MRPRLRAGVLLVLAGLAIAGFGLASRPAPPGPEAAVARAETGAEPMTFRSDGRGEYTIYVDGPDAGSVACEVRRPDPPPGLLSSDRLRNRGAEGADGATVVGTFSTQDGEVTVTCSSADPLYVVEGWTPTSDLGVAVAIGLGAVLVLVGLTVAGWGVRARRSKT